MPIIIPALESWEQAVEEIEKQVQLKLNQKQKSSLLAFYEFLAETNKTMNLTKHSSLSDFLTFHLFDTACILGCLNLQKPFKHYLDLGSGCGVPGIILHILLSGFNSKLKTVLCDSRQKRVQYLFEAVCILNLEKNIYIVNQKAEQMAQKRIYQKDFCLVTARAFAKPLQTLNVVRPFLAPHGQFVYQTSVSLQNDPEYLENLKRKIKTENYFLISDKHRYYGSW